MSVADSPSSVPKPAIGPGLTPVVDNFVTSAPDNIGHFRKGSCRALLHHDMSNYRSRIPPRPSAKPAVRCLVGEGRVEGIGPTRRLFECDLVGVKVDRQRASGSGAASANADSFMYLTAPGTVTPGLAVRISS